MVTEGDAHRHIAAHRFRCAGLVVELGRGFNIVHFIGGAALLYEVVERVCRSRRLATARLTVQTAECPEGQNGGCAVNPHRLRPILSPAFCGAKPMWAELAS